MTREDIKMYVESLFSDRIDKLVEKAGCDLTVTVKRDLVPTLRLDTYDDYIRVEFDTHEINNSDGYIGYEFIPTVTNAGLNQNMSIEDGEEVEYTFKRWADIAAVAYEIYCTEFWPYEYEEE